MTRDRWRITLAIGIYNQRALYSASAGSVREGSAGLIPKLRIGYGCFIQRILRSRN